MRVTFVRDFNWSPKQYSGLVSLAFKAGQTLQVTRECANAARQAGAISHDSGHVARENPVPEQDE